MSSDKRLTILFAPLDGYGHVNVSIALAQALQLRGHRIVFAVASGWSQVLSHYTFETEFYGNYGQASELFKDLVEKYAMVLRKDPLVQMKELPKAFYPFFQMTREIQPKYRQIVKKVNPDIIVIDNTICQPALITAGVPWVLSISTNPISIYPKNCPPAGSGYSANSDKSLWLKFRKEQESALGTSFLLFNIWLMIQRAPWVVKKIFPYFLDPSPHLNLYHYPEELDYTDLNPTLPNFFRCEDTIRSSKDTFELPDKLKNMSGNLIYFSLGSFMSTDFLLMKRLIDMLSKSPHRFIVSKGPLADQYDLPDNMYGERMLPQTAILPLVDLVIHHGGNITVIESLYFGKASIVLPLCGDHVDNAQRLHDKGFGIRLDTLNCTENDLLNTIERLLNDNQLNEKLKKVSERIQNSKSLEKAAQLIEALVPD